MYFSIFDDWSQDRFNEKENNKPGSHGWKEDKHAVSAIKFFEPLDTFPEPVHENSIKKFKKARAIEKKRPPQLTDRNHWFKHLVTPEQVCPEWVQVCFHSLFALFNVHLKGLIN